MPISTWQRPHRPRPPQTESMSTPRLRAAFRIGVPTGKRPRRPEGVKTTRASFRGVLCVSSGKAKLSVRSEEHTSELQSLMRISYAVFCLKKKKNTKLNNNDLIRIHRHKQQY